MIELYAAPTSNGLRAKIMLDETGLNYNLNIVDIAEGANQSDEYLDINPMGLIPTIIDPAGPDGQEVKLSQSMAILMYLANKSGRFMPEHLVNDTMFWRNSMSIATDMTGVLMAILTIGRMDSPHQPTINEFGARYHRYLRYWDGILADQQYAGANEVSIADFAFYPVIFRSKSMIPEFTNDCPNIDRWYEEIGARPGVQKGLDFGHS